MLADWYNRHADVVNRGYSGKNICAILLKLTLLIRSCRYVRFTGYNSRWGLKLVQELMPSVASCDEAKSNPWENLVLATVFFGANDSVFEGEKQYVPLEEYRLNLIAIVNHIRAVAGAHVAVILVTPPVVDSVQWPTRASDNSSKYADAVRAVSIELDTHLLDLWVSKAEMNLTDFRDGLHFGESGNLKMGKGIQRIIRKKIPTLCPEAGFPMQMHFPAHGDLGDAKYLPENACEADYYSTIISSWDWTSK